MRIAFDGTTLQPNRTGVGYYTEHLLHHLAAEVPAENLVVFGNRPPDLSRPLPSGVRVVAIGKPLVRVVWLQTLAPHLIRHAGADIAHFTNGMIPLASRVPAVVTIHDMSLALFPETHPARRLLLNRPLMREAARRAAAIITDSHNSKADIVRIFGTDPDRIHVVHLAAAPHFRPVTDEAALETIRRRHHLPNRFILCVGAIEPRKNLRRLFEAFARRKRSGELPHMLVCAGPYGWLSRDLGAWIERLGIARDVHFTGYVPLEDLPGIYSLAEMFISLSIYEGFGMPPLEAMASGTPVIAGRCATVIEVTGDAADIVDPFDIDGAGAAMVALAGDEERRRDRSVRGLRRAAQFSWERAARETLTVYRSVLAAQPGTAGDRPVEVPAGVPGAGGGVLVGQAYYLRFDPKLWEARQPYPPLGTLYAAAVLRKHGQKVSVFDAMLAESEDEWAAALDRERPAVAVLYEDNFNYLTKMCLLRMRAAAMEMIRMARDRGIPVIVAGSDASDKPDAYLDGGATCVVLGEGESTLCEVVAALLADTKAPLTMPGVCWRDRDGQLVRTPARPPLQNLDQLPQPAWDLIDISRYRAIWRARHGEFSLPVSTTRGCPFHCNWCAKPLYGQRYAVRAPAAVANEIAWLRKELHPDHLWITDDIFGLQPGWVEAFAKALEGHGVRVPFKCLMRADQVSPPVVHALTRAGCRTVWLGAESGSQRVLDAMDKGIQVGQIDEASGLLRAAGIEVGFFLQFGYPGETRSEIAETLALVRRCQPDDIGISVSYPLPGTVFHDRVRAQLGFKQNWVDSDDMDPIYRATYSAEFYRVLHRAVHAEFRVGKAAWMWPLAWRPWRWRRPHMRMLASAVKHGTMLPLLRWRLGRLARASGEDPRVPPMGAFQPGAAVASRRKA